MTIEKLQVQMSIDIELERRPCVLSYCCACMNAISGYENIVKMKVNTNIGFSIPDIIDSYISLCDDCKDELDKHRLLNEQKKYN